MNENPKSESEASPGDLVWGFPAIGREIGRNARQAGELYKAGVLRDAVAKLGHKTFVGRHSKLRNLPTFPSK